MRPRSPNRIRDARTCRRCGVVGYQFTNECKECLDKKQAEMEKEFGYHGEDHLPAWRVRAKNGVYEAPETIMANMSRRPASRLHEVLERWNTKGMKTLTALRWLDELWAKESRLEG